MHTNKANRKDDKILVEPIHIVFYNTFLLGLQFYKFLLQEKRRLYSLFTILNTIIDYLPFLTA